MSQLERSTSWPHSLPPLVGFTSTGFVLKVQVKFSYWHLVRQYWKPFETILIIVVGDMITAFKLVSTWFWPRHCHMTLCMQTNFAILPADSPVGMLPHMLASPGVSPSWHSQINPHLENKAIFKILCLWKICATIASPLLHTQTTWKDQSIFIGFKIIMKLPHTYRRYKL